MRKEEREIIQLEMKIMAPLDSCCSIGQEEGELQTSPVGSKGLQVSVAKSCQSAEMRARL